MSNYIIICLNIFIILMLYFCSINNIYLYIYIYYVFNIFDIFVFFTDKKVSGKSKDEQMAEKKQELEKRLQDVTGQLGNVKKAPKKG